MAKHKVRILLNLAEAIRTCSFHDLKGNQAGEHVLRITFACNYRLASKRFEFVCHTPEVGEDSVLRLHDGW
ncbi:hypothetical protein PSA83_06463 (plasmid) [Pseudomonas aeruginosa]|nr:hypothetical protein PSA83_06463 [Pseudomonas aeruginosa]